MFEQVNIWMKSLKVKTVTLVAAILLTFGLIVTAAPNLPIDAETIVTEPTPRQADRGRRGERGNRDRPPRDARPARLIDDIFDF